MTITHLVTHSGGFHADEVLSSVILTRLFPEAALIRTRDAAWITPGEGKIIYDVGRDFDAGKRIFDHHQPNPPLREDGRSLSSFGLIWAQYGRDYLRSFGLPEEHLDGVHGKIDTGIVVPVDLVDNGVLSPSAAAPEMAELTLPVLLEGLKPVFDDRSEGADDRAFHLALGIARAFVEAAVARRAAKLRAEGMVVDAVRAAGEGRVLELPMGMPFRSVVVREGADQLLFVVTPRDKDWQIGGIRKEEDGFALRADLPASWAGLTDAALEEASGVAGAKFCHNARFIAVAATREAALRMAELAVIEAERTGG